MAEEKKIKKRKTVDTWKKKEWYTIAAPKVFEEKEITTTVASDEKNLLNRVLRVPLRDITGNMNHQFVKMWLRITEVKGKTAHTTLEGFELVSEYLRRNIRRHRSIVKLIKDGTTKDGKKIRLTAYVFTGRKVDTTKKDEIRRLMNEYLSKQIPENTAEELIQKCVFGTTPTEILRETKAVCPIKRVEVSKLKFVRGK
ncbi:MAG: 30S ribosomal protein S3ae [archaeon]